MLRKILGTIAGLIAAVAVISVVQMISGMMYPMPEGVTMDDEAAFNAYVKGLPITAFLMVLLSYIAGSFIGGFIATMIAKTKFIPAFVVGGLLAVAAILNAVAMPQPMWVSGLSVLVMMPMAWMGARLVKSA